MKHLPLLITALVLTACAESCAELKPGIDVATPGKYCFTLEIMGVPGHGEFCYDTVEARDTARSAAVSRGLKVR